MRLAVVALLLIGCGGAAPKASAPRVCAPPAIAPPAPKVMGFCPKMGVVNRVGAGAKDVAQCYEAAIAREPTLAAKLTLVWAIDTQGTARILGIAAGTSSADHCLTHCVIDVVEGWQFPPSPGGLCRVTFPFVFTPATTATAAATAPAPP